MKKLCSICKTEKEEITDFYKSHRNLSGYDNRCKECHKRRSRVIKRLNYDPIKARAKHLLRRKSGKMKESFNKMTEKYPEKHKARYTLGNAVRLGKINKENCKICGDNKSEAHHEDYTKPLEVIWLCRKHHMELHRKDNIIKEINES